MRRIDWFYYCIPNHLFNKKRELVRKIKVEDGLRRETSMVGVI